MQSQSRSLICCATASPNLHWRDFWDLQSPSKTYHGMWFVCACHDFRRGKCKSNILLLNILGSIQSTKQRFEGTWVLTISTCRVSPTLAAEGLGNPGKWLLFSPVKAYLGAGLASLACGSSAQGRENPRLPAEQRLLFPRLVKTKSVAKPNW